MNLIAASKLPLSSITGSMLSGARSNNWVYFVARSGVMRALQPAYSVSPSSILNILKCLLQTRRNQMKSGHSLKHGPRTSQGPGHESRSCAWGNLSNLVPAKHRGCTAWDLYPHPRFWGWFTLIPRIDPCPKIPIYHMRWLWSENYGGFLPKHAHTEPCFHGQCGTRPMEFEKGFVTFWHTNVQRKSLPPSQ